MKPFSMCLTGLLTALCLLCGCHSEPKMTPEEQRPGNETPPVSVHFAESNPSEMPLPEKKTEIHLILYREDAREAPEALFAVDCDGASGTVETASSVRFKAGERNATLSVTVSPGQLAPGKSVTARISLRDTEAEHMLTITAPDTKPTYRTGRYYCPDGNFKVNVEERRNAETRWISVRGKEIERDFKVDSEGVPSLLPTGGVVDARSYADERIEPSFGARGSYDADEGFYAFNAAKANPGPAVSPHREFLQLDGTGTWGEMLEAEYVDGWVVRHVETAFSNPLDPQKNPWRVRVRTRSTGSGTQIQILDPYAGECPIAIVNGADAGAAITVDVPADGEPYISAQPIPFVNSDVWDFVFCIAATEGSFDGKTLIFKTPMHNCSAGHEWDATDRTWAKPDPTALTISD